MTTHHRAGASAQRRGAALALQHRIRQAAYTGAGLAVGAAAAAAATGSFPLSVLAGAGAAIGTWKIYGRTPNPGTTWKIGAKGEKATARLLSHLHGPREGWAWLHDRALPTGKANIDHLGVTPCGTRLVVLDTKQWRKDCTVTINTQGRLCCGPGLREGGVHSLMYEADRVARAAGGRVEAVHRVIVVHGARVKDVSTGRPRIRLQRPSEALGGMVTVDVIQARDLLKEMRALAYRPASRTQAAHLASWAKKAFPAR